jgi:hypothetical protein
MQKSTDPVATIKELYEEDTRQVPYPVFMRCFDKLLADPPSPEPAPPADELKDPFRAVCMALDLGIADRERRGEDRREEFHEHILPAWKEFLPDEEFQAIQEILDGTFRERLEEQRRRQQMEEAEERRRHEDEMASAATRERSARLAGALDAAMRETNEGEETEPPETTGEPPAQERPGGAEGPGETGREETAEEETPTPQERPKEQPKKKRGVPVARTVDALCQALKAGKLPPRYSPPEDRRPLAHYRLRDKRVAVRLMKKGDSFYVILGYGRSLRTIEGVEQKAASLAADCGYGQASTWAFEKTEDGAAQQIRLGSNSTYVTCRKGRKFEVQELTQVIRRMHQDLNHLLRGLRKGAAS